MSGELVRWSGGSVDRVTGRQPARVNAAREVGLAKVEKARDIALARVSAVAEVTDEAMRGTLGLAIVKSQAEMLRPDVSDKLEHLLTKGVLAMGDEIDRMGRA